MNHLTQTVEVGGKEYVVQAVDAQTQYKILQKLAKYGAASLISELVSAESAKRGESLAYVKAVLAIIQLMPEDDQDYCIQNALKKTSLKNDSTPVEVSLFTGRISEYVLLGVRAIGAQLGDFSCFLSLIPKSTAEAQEEQT